MVSPMVARRRSPVMIHSAIAEPEFHGYVEPLEEMAMVKQTAPATKTMEPTQSTSCSLCRSILVGCRQMSGMRTR
jgi:hypothetical protein